MSSKENKEVAVDKADNEKNSGDAKCELKGTKRTAEDKAEEVKKARKEENGAGSEGEDLDEEEEEGVEDGEEDYDEDDIPEGDDDEIEGEEDDDEEVEGEEFVDEDEEDA